MFQASSQPIRWMAGARRFALDFRVLAVFESGLDFSTSRIRLIGSADLFLDSHSILGRIELNQIESRFEHIFCMSAHLLTVLGIPPHRGFSLGLRCEAHWNQDRKDRSLGVTNPGGEGRIKG